MIHSILACVQKRHAQEHCLEEHSLEEHCFEEQLSVAAQKHQRTEASSTKDQSSAVYSAKLPCNQEDVVC